MVATRLMTNSVQSIGLVRTYGQDPEVQPQQIQKDEKENIKIMATQKFMGRGMLLDSLAAQVGDRKKAVAILQKRGHLEADGKTYTAEGMKRNMMTAQERAKDRASK